MREREIYIDYVEGSRRLKLLRENKKLSHQKLSEKTGINKQSLVNYERAGKDDGRELGTRINAFGGMSVNSAVALAKTLGVSTDYLLGLAEVSSPDANVQAICKYTGLSQSAVEHLHTCVEQLQKDNSYFDIINSLLSNDDFYHSIAYLKRAKRVEDYVSDQKQANLEGFNMLQSFAESFSDHEVMSGDINSGVRLSHRQSIDFYLQCASDCFRRLCNLVVKGDEK